MKDGLLIEFPGQNLRSYISILLPFIAVITPIVVMVPVSELIQKPFNPFQVFALALSLIGIYKLSKVIRKQKIIVSEIKGLTVINYYFIKPAKVRNIPVDMFSGSSLILTDREEDKKFPFTLPIIGGIYKFFLLPDISEVAASGESGNLYFGNALPFKEKIIILNLINNILKNS